MTVSSAVIGRNHMLLCFPDAGMPKQLINVQNEFQRHTFAAGVSLWCQSGTKKKDNSLQCKDQHSSGSMNKRIRESWTYRDGDLGRLLRGIAIGVQTCMVTAHIRIQIDLIASRNRSPREPILILPVEVESSLAVLAESETHAVQILWNSTDGAVPDAFVDGAALTLFWTTDGAQRREVY